MPGGQPMMLCASLAAGSGLAPPDGRVSELLGDFGRGDMMPPGLPSMPHLPPGSGDLIPPGSGMMVGPDHPMFRQGRCAGC